MWWWCWIQLIYCLNSQVTFNSLSSLCFFVTFLNYVCVHAFSNVFCIRNCWWWMSLGLEHRSPSSSSRSLILAAIRRPDSCMSAEPKWKERWDTNWNEPQSSRRYSEFPHVSMWVFRWGADSWSACTQVHVVRALSPVGNLFSHTSPPPPPAPHWLTFPARGLLNLSLLCFTKQVDTGARAFLPSLVSIKKKTLFYSRSFLSLTFFSFDFLSPLS